MGAKLNSNLVIGRKVRRNRNTNNLTHARHYLPACCYLHTLMNMLVVAPPKVLSIFPLDPVSCALYNFSGENVNLHFKHIHEGMKITTCR